MLSAVFGLALAGPAAFGAPYPASALQGAVDRQTCMTRYTLTTADPIDQVARFYAGEAAASRTQLLGDSGAKFTGYRMLAFVSQPRFLWVLLSRTGGVTTARVSYHLTRAVGCR